MNPTIRLVLTVAVLVLLSLYCRSVSAQGNQVKQIRKTIDQAMSRIKVDKEQQVAASIEDIDRVCQLTDEQKTNLRVASKGAVEKSMVATRKQFAATMKNFGMWPAGMEQIPESDEADVEELKDDDVDEMADILGEGQLNYVIQVMQHDGNSNKLHPEKQRLWTSTIKNTLTEEQAQKYAAMVKERNARCRRTAVESFISTVDLELRLSLEQRDEMVALVNDKYGEVLLTNLSRSGDEAMQELVIRAIRGHSSSSLVDKDIRRVLSESQYHLWKTKFAKQLESIAALNGQQEGRRGGLWGGFFGN